MSSKIIILFLILFSALSTHQPIKEPPPNVIIITIDGVRWQDIFSGKDPSGNAINSEKNYPNLYFWFIKNGITFGNFSEVRVSGPAHISLPGYLEIMRGYPTLDCLSNECDKNIKPTLVNQFNSSAVFSSWETIDHVVDNTPVMSTGRNYTNDKYNALKLIHNKNYPVVWDNENYRPDYYTVEAVYNYLENNKPEFLWVSLGDTDEYAHAGNYDGYVYSLKFADHFIGQFISKIRKTEYGKNAVIIVTVDHGRSNDWRSHGWDPESARTWIMINGKSIPPLGMVQLKETVHPSNIFPTVMELRNDSYNNKSLLNFQLYIK